MAGGRAAYAPSSAATAGDAAGSWADNATVERREAASRLRGTGSRLASVRVAPYERAKGSAPPGAPPAPRFGVAVDRLSPRIRGSGPAEAPARQAEMRWKPKNKKKTTMNPRRETGAAGTRGAAPRQCGGAGCFDIVKTERGRGRGRASSPGPRPGAAREAAIRRRIAAEIDVRASGGARVGQPTAVQVPSGLRQAVPRASCGRPSI